MHDHDHHDGCGCGHDHGEPRRAASHRGAPHSATDDAFRPALLAVSVGNTRTALMGASLGGRGGPVSLPNEPFDALAAAVVREYEAALEADSDADALIASVNDSVADRLAVALERAAPSRESALRLGRDVPIPIRHTLDEEGERTVGQDRLLNAIGAFEAVRQACVVVDAGTAITVDFVDGEGVFHGGAIAPGARMMLRAMHQGTAALPDVMLALPETMREGASPFGRNTPEAMLTGVVHAARGLVRSLAERYAERYEAYPQILATGGDAALLFEGDELIETIVPDLTLRGVAVSYARWAADAAS